MSSSSARSEHLRMTSTATDTGRAQRGCLEPPRHHCKGNPRPARNSATQGPLGAGQGRTLLGPARSSACPYIFLGHRHRGKRGSGRSRQRQGKRGEGVSLARDLFSCSCLCAQVPGRCPADALRGLRAVLEALLPSRRSEAFPLLPLALRCCFRPGPFLVRREGPVGSAPGQ